MRPLNREALSPEGFELAVKGLLEEEGLELDSFASAHLEKVFGTDGDYVFDVTVRFRAMGASFLMVVECKNTKRKVERSDLQILQQKIQSVGAQKGMVVSATGFQQGAHEFASAHGLALVRIMDGAMQFHVRGGGEQRKPSWLPAVSFSLEQPQEGAAYSATMLGAIHLPDRIDPSRRVLMEYLLA